MKKVTIILLVLAITGSISFADETVLNKDGMKVEIEDTTIIVPPGWFAQYTKSPQVFFLYSPLEENDTFQENCNLVTEMLPVEYSIEAYMDASLESIKAVYSGFLLEEKGANYILISGEINNIPLKQLQYYFIREQIAYVLTFSSNPTDFGKYDAVFREIAESFSFER